MELTEKFEKDNCKNPVEYSIIHKEIPIKMSSEIDMYPLYWTSQ